MEKDDTLGNLQSHLTQLAETTLDTAIHIVTDELEINNLNMAVLGLGKMGTSTMAPKSDLDIVFIFEDEVESELASQVVRRALSQAIGPLEKR